MFGEDMNKSLDVLFFWLTMYSACVIFRLYRPYDIIIQQQLQLTLFVPSASAAAAADDDDDDVVSFIYYCKLIVF